MVSDGVRWFQNKTQQCQGNAAHSCCQKKLRPLPTHKPTAYKVADDRSQAETEEYPGEIFVTEIHPGLQNMQPANQRPHDQKKATIDDQ